MIFVKNNKLKAGETLVTAILFSAGLMLFGTILGYNVNDNREILRTEAQSMCTYTGIAQVLQEDGAPLVDQNLRIRSRFTDNSGRPYDNLESFDSAGRNEKNNFAFDKQKYDGARVTLNLKNYDQAYEIIHTWCTENGQDCGSIGREEVKSYIRCDSNVAYGWKLKRKAGSAPQPTTPPQQQPGQQVCSAVNASCYDEYVESCATGTRTCYKTGTCTGPGNGLMCQWQTDSCCSACSDPAGNDNNTCGNRQPPNTPVPQATQRPVTATPQPTQRQATNTPQPTQSAQRGIINGRISISTGTLPADRWLKLDRCDSTGCHSPTYLQNNGTFTFNNAPYGTNTLSISKWVYDSAGVNKEYYDTLRINNCGGGQSEGNTFCAVNVNSAQTARNLTVEIVQPTTPPQPTATLQPTVTTDRPLGKVSGVINIRNQSNVIYQIGAMAISICQETTCLRYDQNNAGTFTIRDYPDSRTMNFNYSFNYFPSNPTRRLEVGDNNLSIKLSVDGTTWTNAQPLNQITSDLKQNINYIIPTISGTITADINGDNQIDSTDFFTAQQAFGKELTINGRQQQVSALFISYIIANMGREVR